MIKVNLNTYIENGLNQNYSLVDFSAYFYFLKNCTDFDYDQTLLSRQRTCNNPSMEE